MFSKKIGLIFTLCLILLLSIVSVVQAAPPLQEPDDGDTTTATSFDLNEDGKPVNLGCIVSGQCEPDDTGETAVDSDGDGIPDDEEKVTDYATGEYKDTDGDGIPDYLDAVDGENGDSDIDGDGVYDVDELVDNDGDGIPDILDPDDQTTDGTGGDSDGDGVNDVDELKAVDGEIVDTDGDGLPDYLDPDSDNDGIGDGQEYAVDENGDPVDTDGDGIPDFQDGETIGEGDKAHPVIKDIADYYGEAYDLVKSAHEEGYGLGVLQKALEAGIELNDLIGSGIRGWGNIRKCLDNPDCNELDGNGGSQGGTPSGQLKKGNSIDTLGALSGPGGGKGNNGNGQGKGNKGGNGKGVSGKPTDKPEGGQGHGNKGGNGGNGKGHGKNK